MVVAIGGNEKFWPILKGCKGQAQRKKNQEGN